MERRGLRLPLLIGGATTSRQHTAVRIAPAYSGPTVHVLDASRAVNVAAELLDPARRDGFVARVRAEQEEQRQLHAGRRTRPLLPLAEARARRTPIAFRAEDLPKPEFLGRRLLLDEPLEEIVPFIDWTFFFTAWELKGRFPAILESPQYGPAARELYAQGRRLLDRMVRERRVRANAVYGFWRAAAEGDDLVLYEAVPDARPQSGDGAHAGGGPHAGADPRAGGGSGEGGDPRAGAGSRALIERVRFPMLRRQQDDGGGEPCFCLADFVAPKGIVRGPAAAQGATSDAEENASAGAPDVSLEDHVGAFAVTAGLGLEDFVHRLEAEHDDYSALIAKALADRLAEALAERLHQRVRREWGYGRDEQLELPELIAEKFRGIRPAFGYPACPDHAEKEKLFDLLGATEAGLRLTESWAMLPPASVSGLYLAHPRARYFNVGRIGRDQVEDYARRQGVSEREIERRLGTHLAYEP